MNIKSLLPHQQRVVIERDDLAERLLKLDSFITTSAFKAIDINERTRLSRQSELMHQLLKVLDERIAAF